MLKRKNINYVRFVSELKKQISQSRYQAAKLVNKEIIMLYFKIGHMISEKVEKEGWGTGTLNSISKDLQKAFPGLRGFSVRNMFNMQLFFNEYKDVIMQTLSAQLHQPNKYKKNSKKKNSLIMQTVSAQLDTKLFLHHFFNIGFSHHVLILSKCKTLKERIFYTIKSAENNWSYRVLEYNIDSGLIKHKGKILNNFKSTLPKKIAAQAINAFKDEYFLNFINLNEDDNEQELEEKIIKNIQKFLMSLGEEFSFVGRQYRLLVSKKEYFIDLLFYNRRLQALVAFDLKTTEFKPEHAGKMDFYLTALDKQVKLPHENDSIGIILCKEKDKTVVEYSLHNKQNALGVSIYSYNQLPKKYQNALPNPKTLSKLLQ